MSQNRRNSMPGLRAYRQAWRCGSCAAIEIRNSQILSYDARRVRENHKILIRQNSCSRKNNVVLAIVLAAVVALAGFGSLGLPL